MIILNYYVARSLLRFVSYAQFGRYELHFCIQLEVVKLLEKMLGRWLELWLAPRSVGHYVDEHFFIRDLLTQHDGVVNLLARTLWLHPQLRQRNHLSKRHPPRTRRFIKARLPRRTGSLLPAERQHREAAMQVGQVRLNNFV